MFIENHKAALLNIQDDVGRYMNSGVVVDSDGYLSVMLPIARNTIAIKFAENDSVIAGMVTHALTMFEKICTGAEAYAFYNKMMESVKLHDRVMQFVAMMILIDEPEGTLAISRAVDKKNGKLLSDIRIVGDYFGLYDKKARSMLTVLRERNILMAQPKS